MNATEQARPKPLVASLQRALKLRGKAKATKDAYCRAVRRACEYFDRCPDDLSAEKLRDHDCILNGRSDDPQRGNKSNNAERASPIPWATN